MEDRQFDAWSKTLARRESRRQALKAGGAGAALLGILGLRGSRQATAQDNDVQLRIVEATLAVNDNRKRAMARKVAHALGGNLRGKTIALLGLTFKPDTDDMREAPSIPLVTSLHDMGATVRAFDPVGMEQAKLELPDIEYCNDAYSCAQGADALVIVTEWVQFRALDLARLRATMTTPVIVDLRNVYQPENMIEAGFIYESIGRPTT